MKHHRELRLLNLITDTVILTLICLVITVVFGGWWLGY